MLKLTNDRPVFDSETEQRIELIKNVAQQRMELAKRFSGIKSILQSYLKGTMELHLHLSVIGDGVCIRCLDAAGHAARLNVSKMSMFVAVGQSVKHLEQRESVVRLKPLNQCDLFGCQILQGPSSGPVRSLWEILLALINRKLSAFLFSPSVIESKVVNDVVQRSASVKGILADQTSRFWCNLEKQIGQNLDSIFTRLTDGGLECVINPPLNERFKLIELFPCPFYSDLGCDELVHAEPFPELQH